MSSKKPQKLNNLLSKIDGVDDRINTLTKKIEDIKKFISEKRVIYDYKADQKKYKWSGKSVLKKIENKHLPGYINENLSKYSDWLD